MEMPPEDTSGFTSTVGELCSSERANEGGGLLLLLLLLPCLLLLLLLLLVLLPCLLLLVVLLACLLLLANSVGECPCCASLLHIGQPTQHVLC